MLVTLPLVEVRVCPFVDSPSLAFVPPASSTIGDDFDVLVGVFSPVRELTGSVMACPVVPGFSEDKPSLFDFCVTCPISPVVSVACRLLVAPVLLETVKFLV